MKSLKNLLHTLGFRPVLDIDGIITNKYHTIYGNYTEIESVITVIIDNVKYVFINKSMTYIKRFFKSMYGL